MGNDMEMDSAQTVNTFVPGNKEACKRYYARNAKAAKRRVLLNDISRFGRMSKEATFEKWDITIHDVIQAFRIYKTHHPENGDKILAFRRLIGNMV